MILNLEQFIMYQTEKKKSILAFNKQKTTL